MGNAGETETTCLLCKSEATKRGLCAKHYERFRRAKNELPVKQRAEYDQWAVDRGLVLSKEETRRLAKQDEFLDLLAEFQKASSDARALKVAEDAGEYSAEAEEKGRQLAEEAARIARELTAERRARTKGK